MKDSLFVSFSALIVLLAFGLGWWFWKRKQRKAKYPEEPIKPEYKCRIGIIQKLEFTHTFNFSERTAFEIQEKNGSIFYAGIYGHQRELKEGDMIEFWPSNESIGNKTIPVTEINIDGTKTVRSETIFYYNLEKYRVRKQLARMESELGQVEN